MLRGVMRILNRGPIPLGWFVEVSYPSVRASPAPIPCPWARLAAVVLPIFVCRIPNRVCKIFAALRYSLPRQLVVVVWADFL